jgi:hypothetical protein
MPPRNPARRGGTAATQADSDGTGAPASKLTDKATPDVSALIRQELAAAAAELKKEFFTAGRAYKLLGAAGFAGYMALLFASIAVWAALATVLASGTAAVIVAFIWAVAGTVLYVLGRRERELRTKSRRTTKAARKRPGNLKVMAGDLSGTLKRAVRR